MSIKADNQRLCLKVIDRIKDDIQNGVFCENERLPSEFELSKMLGVSRTALREALRMLEEENVIIRRHGVGCFVNARPLFLSGIEQLNSVTKMIEQASMTPGTIFMSSQVTAPTEEDMLRFQYAEETEIFLLEREKRQMECLLSTVLIKYLWISSRKAFHTSRNRCLNGLRTNPAP